MAINETEAFLRILHEEEHYCDPLVHRWVYCTEDYLRRIQERIVRVAAYENIIKDELLSTYTDLLLIVLPALIEANEYGIADREKKVVTDFIQRRLLKSNDSDLRCKAVRLSELLVQNEERAAGIRE